MGKKGARQTLGVPGTGLYYTNHDPWVAYSRSKGPKGNPIVVGAQAGLADRHVGCADGLSLGFFKRLTTPLPERSFVDGCRFLYSGEIAQSISALQSASSRYPDAAFLCGVIHLREECYQGALRFLEIALAGRRELGALFTKYSLEASISIPIAQGVWAIIGPRERGVRLALAEVHQALEQWDRVIDDLEELQREIPDDLVVRLSYAEILIDAMGTDRGALKRVLQLADGVHNDSYVHAALLLQKARALRGLSMPTAALEVLSRTLRRRKDRPPDLMNSLRYERALAYEELGKRAASRRDLERIFASDPEFKDVPSRLGLQ